LTSNDRRSFPFISAWLPEQCHKLSEECVQPENRLNRNFKGWGSISFGVHRASGELGRGLRP